MNARDGYLLGLDAGTSVVKAALFYPDGRESVSVSRRTTLKHPHSAWAEVSMIETWDMAAEAIRSLLDLAGVRGEQIAAVGITGNMVGAWLIDAQGRPVRDAILWCDGRSQGLIDRLSEAHPGFMSRIFEVSGGVMQQGCTLPVLRWLAENEPSALDRASTVLCCKDWLAYRLTGSIQLDPSEASVMPGDVRQRTYSEEMIDLLGVRPYRHLFPAVQPSESMIGTVHAAAAEATGLKAGTPVAAGAGDVPASIVGAGAFEPGTACSLLGTNFLNCLVVDQPVFEPRDVGVSFCLPGGNWLRAMINVSGTTSLDWAVDQFCQPEKQKAESNAVLFESVEHLMQDSAPGARGVIYLPYLSPQGITAPIAEPAARAEFFGLTNEHTRADLMRAVYEGLAFSVRSGYDCIPRPVGEIRLVGGAARSRFFCQMIADCTGRRVIVPRGSEFGAKGAALLAAVGTGWYRSIAEAVTAASVGGQSYEPDARLRPIYDHGYDLYNRLREALIPVWRQNALR